MGIAFNLVKIYEEQRISQITLDWFLTATTRDRPREEHMLEVQMTQVSEEFCK